MVPFVHSPVGYLHPLSQDPCLTCTLAKKYTEDHEAVVFDDTTGLGTITITDYAQASLGDVVFVELPTLGTEVTQGGESRKSRIPVWTVRAYMVLSRSDWCCGKCEGCF